MVTKDLTIYRFNIVDKNNDGTLDYELGTGVRYVAAFSEEEAERKMEAYRLQLVANGFADIEYFYKGVDTEYVIF